MFWWVSNGTGLVCTGRNLVWLVAGRLLACNGFGEYIGVGGV